MSLAHDFKHWVGEQPATKHIDHISWYGCAIGLYAGSRPGEITIDDVTIAIRNQWGHQAYMFIGNGGKSSGYPTPWDDMSIDTYGGLYQWLNQL